LKTKSNKIGTDIALNVIQLHVRVAFGSFDRTSIKENAVLDLKSITIISAIGLTSLLGSTVSAAPFLPVLDEFWVVKGDNGGPAVETFRDSFNDTVLPPSGPQDGLGGNPNTYNVTGGAGMISEAAGKLTMNPSLGSPTLITGVTADTFTGATKLRSTSNGNTNSLEHADSFEIHGLFDLSNLPTVTGQNFGIRATDRRGGSTPNAGNDVMMLSVAKSGISGNIGVRLAEIDFVADTIETADFQSISSFLSTAVQIELIISKQSSTDLIDASFVLYDAANSVIHTASLDTIGNVSGQPLNIYNDEIYTRAQFFATDTGIPIPAPPGLLLFALSIAGVGFARRKRSI